MGMCALEHDDGAIFRPMLFPVWHPCCFSCLSLLCCIRMDVLPFLIVRRVSGSMDLASHILHCHFPLIYSACLPGFSLLRLALPQPSLAHGTTSSCAIPSI